MSGPHILPNVPSISQPRPILLDTDDNICLPDTTTRLSPKDVFVWDVVTWSRAYPLWLPEVTGNSLECLEVGAGLGGLSLLLAYLGHRVRCTDQYFPTRAVEYHRRFQFRGQIVYEAADLLSCKYRSQFDVIVCRSVIGSIGIHGGLAAQHAALETLRMSLKPGGALLLAENLAASPIHSLARRITAERRWRWRYPTLSEILSILSGFSSLQYRTVGFAAAFGLTETQRRIFGRVDSYLDRLVSAAWRYVWLGVARR